MGKDVKLFESEEEISGKHLRSNQWIIYTGRLTIYDRTEKPVILKIKSEIFDSFISVEMEDTMEFKGENITQVYQKLVSWFTKKGVKF